MIELCASKSGIGSVAAWVRFFFYVRVLECFYFFYISLIFAYFNLSLKTDEYYYFKQVVAIKHSEFKKKVQLAIFCIRYNDKKKSVYLINMREKNNILFALFFLFY